MRNLYGLLTMLLMFCWSATQAQVKDVTGQVTDSRDGSPLAKVTVKVKGSNVTTETSADGSFSLKAPANATELIFSYVGYNDLEAPIKSVMEIQLVPGDKSLNEVVVVGYGTRIKRDVTGSIAKVSAKELGNTPVTSFESALQGRAAGVMIEQGSGKLGQAIKVRIRGAASVTGGNEPLYVVDGIPVITTNLSSNGAPTNPLADLNINDIESIEVLKDASSAAIYGARASNGVVLITTKKGKAGKSKVDFGFYTGMQKPTRKVDFMNAEEYVGIMQAAAVGRAKYDWRMGTSPYASEQEAIDGRLAILANNLNFFSADNEDWKTFKVNTDWQEEAFQRAPISQYDINLSGGNEKTTFYMGLQYLDQKGIMIQNELKRYNGRLNVDHKASNWLNVGMNMSFARSVNKRIPNDNAFSNPLQMVAQMPITPLIDPRTGKLSGAEDPNDNGNPNSDYPVYYNGLLNVQGASYNTTVYRTLGNLYAQAQIAEGLSFRSEFGVDALIQNEEAYYGPITVVNSVYPKGGGFTSDEQVLNLTTNNFLRYAKVFNDDHSFEVVGGMSWQEYKRMYGSGTAESFPSEAYKKLVSAAVKSNVTSEAHRYSFLAYFARANYKFKDKYLLALSGRYDGSSRFGANNQWGFFPAVSAGWIISEEDFLKSSQLISFLKLKGSYGLTGNAEIGNNSSLGLWSGDAAYGGIPGQRPTQIANPNLKWETTTSADLGFEVGFLNNRISVEFDIYERRTKDLLLSRNVPGTTGFRTQTVNLGELTNKGIEFSITSDNIVTKDFRWSTNINFGLNKNKVTNLQGEELGLYENRAKEGEPIGVFVGKEYAGVDPSNGDAIYYLNTRKSDGTLDRTTTNNYDAAQTVTIGDPNPDFIYGIRNNLSYKGFDAEILIQGVQGNQIYSSAGQYTSNNSNYFDNQTSDQLSYWKKPGDITNVPEPRYLRNNGNAQSSRYVSDGSYLRVKAVTIGYNLPKSILNKIKFERVRVYVRGQNLATITNYKGWDPEVNADFNASNINQGVDFYTPPQARAIIFGLNIGL